jgi:rhodanese-related sulfurtransferase
MKIRVVPRKWFLDRKGTDEEKDIFQKWNVISIITPAYPKKDFEEEDIPFSEEYRNADNVLVLKFHDTEIQWDDDVVLMNESDADKVYDFVQNTKDNGKGYLVHCTAGKSRSQATGYILNLWFNSEYGISPNPEEYNEYEDLYANTRHMNSLVKRLLYGRFFGGIV